MASRVMPQSDSPFNKPRPTISLPATLKKAIEVAATPYPKPAGRKFEYGTAGVSRTQATMLHHCHQTTDLTVLLSSG